MGISTLSSGLRSQPMAEILGTAIGIGLLFLAGVGMRCIYRSFRDRPGRVDRWWR